MKTTTIAAALLGLTVGAAGAETIGVSFATFDDRFHTVMRDQMEAYAATLEGVELQFEDAQNDVGRQLDQVNNFIASGVDAVIVTAVDASAAQALTDAAAAGGVPLIYSNREPANVATLPDDQAFVGSNEIESGTLGAFEACKLLRAAGLGEGARGYILMGDLATSAAIQRTKDVHDVVAMDMCSFMEVVDEQTANWQRDEAQDLMTNWLSGGDVPDFVFANNDEMAVGAVQAMKAAGLDMSDVVVVGVDATPDALAAMEAGEIDVTVFQNAAAIAAADVDTALALARGEGADQSVFVPFELVTPDNAADYVGRN